VETSPATPFFSKNFEASLSFEEYVIDGRKQDCEPINSRKVHDFSGLTDRSGLNTSASVCEAVFLGRNGEMLGLIWHNPCCASEIRH
jgi:hypothetical protein